MTTGIGDLGTFLTDVDATPTFTLGTATIQNNFEYLYVRAGAAIAAGDALILDNSVAAERPFRMTPATAVNQAVQAIAPVAIASGSYGWVLIRGRVNAKVAASTAAAAQLGSSGTAGTLSTVTVSASPTQAEVQRVLAVGAGRGMTAVAAESGGFALVELR